MPLADLPQEILLEIAKSLRFADYSGFRSFLALRHTCRQFHETLEIPEFAELDSHIVIFMSPQLLPCSICRRLRPYSHFFRDQRRDGIGTLVLLDSNTIHTNPISGPYYVPSRNEFCIDCGVSEKLYLRGERFTGQNGNIYCVCMCCGGLGRSSLHMQVCVECFDEDYGGSTPHECHRKGQADKLTDLTRPASIVALKDYSSDLRLPNVG